MAQASTSWMPAAVKRSQDRLCGLKHLLGENGVGGNGDGFQAWQVGTPKRADWFQTGRPNLFLRNGSSPGDIQLHQRFKRRIGQKVRPRPTWDVPLT